MNKSEQPGMGGIISIKPKPGKAHRSKNKCVHYHKGVDKCWCKECPRRGLDCRSVDCGYYKEY